MENNMLNSIEKSLSNKTGGLEIFEQFMAILELPDEQFRAVSANFSREIKNTMSNPIVRKQILNELELSPIEDLESEIKGMNELLAQFETEETFSKEKKEFMRLITESGIELVKEVIENPRQIIEVKVQKIHEKAILPTYAHNSDAGADIYAVEDTVINPNETKVVKTGLKTAIPLGYEIQIRPRSGLSLKTGLRLANSIGTIDAAYRGEIGVIFTNTAKEPYTIKAGDKIAQMMIMPIPMIKWNEVQSLDSTERGEGGFGSTGN